MQGLEEGLCDKKFRERVALDKIRKRNAERAIQAKKTACLMGEGTGRARNGMLKGNASWKSLREIWGWE